MKRIVIAGGSGFLGRTLAAYLQAQGYQVVVLSRRSLTVRHAAVVTWDGRTLGPWAQQLEGAAALINMAGRSVNCRYHARNRHEIMSSRVLSTRILGEAVAQCRQSPAVWLNSSTATIYRHTYGHPHGEVNGEVGADPAAKDAFSVEVATAWENEFTAAPVPGCRKVILRTAMVMGPEPGGVHDVLCRLTRIGLGGKMGDGRQFVSWLHAADFCRAVEWITNRDAAEGIYNLAAPHPVTNAEMMRTLRKVYGVPVGLPAARWMLEAGTWLMRTESELVIKSRNVIPQRLLKEGFVFSYPEFEAAIRQINQDTGRAAAT